MKKPTTKKASTPVEGIAEIGFDVSAPAKGSASTKYPMLTGDDIAALVDRIIGLHEKFEAVADPFKAAKQTLVEAAFPQWFEVNHGKVEVPSSMVGRGTKGGVRVTFQDRFTAGDKQALYDLLTVEVAARFFRQQWEVKIKSDKVPPETGAAFIGALKRLMNEHGIIDALEVKAQIVPVDGFGTTRHGAFSPETNLEINAIVPQRTMVSTKGVK